MDHTSTLPAPGATPSRPDQRTAACIQAGVKLVTSHGRATAQRYLREQGVGASTIARVLGPDGHRRNCLQTEA